MDHVQALQARVSNTMKQTRSSLESCLFLLSVCTKVQKSFLMRIVIYPPIILVQYMYFLDTRWFCHATVQLVASD